MLVSQVRRTLLERELIEENSRVLVACSGGPDSAALLSALSRLAPEMRFSMAAASVNHGLREAAASEVEIAGLQAKQLGVPFHPLEIKVPSGASVQANARAARYDALKELAREIGAHRVATGHTRDDQAETVVMRLLRGSGVEGLSGIDPRRDDGVIRPLIDCRRSEVHRFAHQSFSEIVLDPSNLDRRFERVRVRLELLPALEKEDPSVVQHLADLADDAREQTQLVEEQAELLLEQADRGEEGLSLAMLKGTKRSARRAALRLWVRRQTGIDPGRSHLDQLDRALGNDGEIWLPGGWVALVDIEALRCVFRGSRG